MTGFPTPIQHKIYCVFKDKDKTDIEIPEKTYNEVRSYADNDTMCIEDSKGRILFEGKRREIREFKHVYPKDNSGIPDEYKIYSAEYNIEKEKRDKFWNNYSNKMSQDDKDSVWSIIMARWGNTYKEAKEGQYGGSWKSYFSGMFKIIALELAGHKDKISSKEGIINKWSDKFEIPEMYDNLPMYREFIK